MSCRAAATRLFKCIQHADEAGAVSIIEDCRKTAWLRNIKTGDYAVHEAVKKVRIPRMLRGSA